MRVTVWHNISTDQHTRNLGMMDGYEPGHALVPVAVLDVGTPQGLKVATDELTEEERLRLNNALHAILDKAYEVFNVSDDPSFGTPNPLAVEYRKRKNRSLSVGDVIQLSTRRPSEHPISASDRWSKCTSFGWTPIEAPVWFAIGASCHGTTSLDRDRYNR